jgi:hypothetical protein
MFTIRASTRPSTPGAGGCADGITDLPQQQFSVTYALTTDRRRQQTAGDRWQWEA